MNNITILNEFNFEEFENLCSLFNKSAYIQEQIIYFANKSFFEKMKYSIQKDRRGEVVFGVFRPNGKVIAVTCEEYPDNVFRIPTGGIGYQEDIAEALHREVMEELGLTAQIRSFIGVVKFRFVYCDEEINFYSYIFALDETGGQIMENATDNEISAYVEADESDLEKIALKLKNIEGPWHDWGVFRYYTTKSILDYWKCRQK